VRLPVQPGNYTVQDNNGVQQAIQLVPIPKEVISVPERADSLATHDLVFQAANLPPLGFRSYYVTKVSSSFTEVTPSDEMFIGDADLQLTLDADSGLVKTITKGGVEIPLQQNFHYYQSSSTQGARFSGAYIFRPDGSGLHTISTKPEVKVYKGDIVDEIHQTFSSWISQVVRIYKQENHVEFEWLVGPIPIDDDLGKEVISRFTTDLQTNGLFYTDSNGRELLERKRNYRPTWNLNLTEPESGNYYPVTSKILIRDTVRQQELAVLNDRSQGGSSLNDGQVELMVHRRILYDDSWGVDEALNETAFGKGLVARGRHYVMAGATNGVSPNMAAQERELANRKLLSPWLFFSPGGTSFENWRANYSMEYSGLKESLPMNVHLLTVEPWKEGALLLRLEHIMEANEDSVLSLPVEVAYEDLFTAFNVTSTRQTTLAGNQWVEDVNKLVWKSASDRAKEQSASYVPGTRAATLKPMEIGTYIINVT